MADDCKLCKNNPNKCCLSGDNLVRILIVSCVQVPPPVFNQTDPRTHPHPLPVHQQDECYADNQVLRSKCDAEVFVELVNAQSGEPIAVPGMEVQVRAECLNEHKCDAEVWVRAEERVLDQTREQHRAQYNG